MDISAFLTVLLILVVTYVNSEKIVTYTVGDNATLPCETTLEYGVEWIHCEWERSTPHVVFSRGVVLNGYRERFTVNSPQKHVYNLAIGNIRLSDAGIYRCIEDDGIGDEKVIRVSVELPAMVTTSAEVLAAFSEPAKSVDAHTSEMIHHENLGITYLEDHYNTNHVLIWVSVFAVLIICIVAVTVVLTKRHLNKAIDAESDACLKHDNSSDSNSSLPPANRVDECVKIPL